MATGSNWSSSTKSHTNFARLCRLLIDGETQVVKGVFDSFHSPSTLHSVLHNPANHNILKGLKGRVIKKRQWEKLYPSIRSSVTSSGFDITLLFVLLRNICSLTPPTTGWDRLPAATDTSREADLARIKWYRNELYGHITETAISDSDFEKCWKEIEAVLVRLGRPYCSNIEDDIERLKVETMDPEDEQYFVKALKEWEEFEQTVMSQLEQLEQTAVSKLEQSKKAVVSKVEQSEQTVLSRLEQLEQTVASKPDNVTKVEQSTSIADDSKCKDYTKRLKSSIKSQTDFHSGMKEWKRIRTDDIFTNVTIQRGFKTHQAKAGRGRGYSKRKADREPELNDRKRIKTDDGIRHQAQAGIGRKQFVRGYTVLKKCSELFICPAEDEDPLSKDLNKTNPKSILVIGQPGIGKSLFCQKLARDWANDSLFDKEESNKLPVFPFAVLLLTFRQLHLLVQEKLDLRELLNLCNLLNEQSNLDDALFEYILQNPEKLLLIIDGYDEYSHSDEVQGDSETAYPNEPREKLPVPIMVAKLLKGKILQDSVVMVTSRPCDKIKKLEENFDVKAEIIGFSPQQVEEFAGKYFKDNESMKNTVLDHFDQHENLFEILEVPVICFLMCYYLEWHLTHLKSDAVDLPVTRTELYHEVIKVFIKEHHGDLKYAEDPKVGEVEKTLKALSFLASTFLEKEVYIFEENDLKNLDVDMNKEVSMDSLKASGVLYCCPGIKTFPFAKVTFEYAFIHLTLQEYLAAYWFVEKGEIPKKASDMVLQFMSGLLARNKNDKLMLELVESIEPAKPLTTAKCLYEHGDTNIAKRVVEHRFSDFTREGKFYCDSTRDTNSIFSLTFVLDIISLLNEVRKKRQVCDTKSFDVYVFDMSNSTLTVMGLRRIKKSLTNVSCTVTRVDLNSCYLKDEGAEVIGELLTSSEHFQSDTGGGTLNTYQKEMTSICKSLKNPNCKLTNLELDFNQITDKGVTSICEALKNSNCKLTYLSLSNNQITDKGVSSICETLKNSNCKLTYLSLSNNQITDKNVTSIFESMRNPDCKLTNLNLGGNKITDEGVTSICEALKTPNCKLTNLDLHFNQITDKGVTSICEALKNPNCKLTNLDLQFYQITDKGVTSICEALKNPNCKLTNLDINQNNITDKGVTSIGEALKNPNCKLTNLVISQNNITDEGVTSICEALKTPNCKLANLELYRNQITDKGVTSICEALENPNCKLTNLELYNNQITDKGVTSICEALKNPNCKLTNLGLGNNQITDKGVTSICEALKNPNCKLTNLDLEFSEITDKGVTSIHESLENPNCNVVLRI